MKSSNVKTAIGYALGTVVPFLCKWMTDLTQPGYRILAWVFGVLGFAWLVFVACTDKTKEVFIKKYRWPLVCFLVALASICCLVLFPSISVKSSEQQRFDLVRKEIEEDIPKAENNDVDAMLRLGKVFSTVDSEGIFGQDYSFIDYAKAEMYYEMASRENSVEAYCELARMKSLGKGRKSSRSRAIDELRHAFEINRDSPTLIRTLYDLGIKSEEFPEGYAAMSVGLENFHRLDEIKYNETQAARSQVDSIIQQYHRLFSHKVDTAEVKRFCKEALTVLDSLPQVHPAINGLKAGMLWHLHEYVQARSIVQNALSKYGENVFEGEQLALNIMETGRAYSEMQESLDSILNLTSLNTLQVLYEERDLLAIDSFYVDALKLEMLNKRITPSSSADNKHTQINIISAELQASVAEYKAQSSSVKGKRGITGLGVDIEFNYTDGTYALRYYKIGEPHEVR